MILNEEEYFKIYSNCLLVRGRNRSVICDLQKNIFKLIPNDLFEILDRFDGHSISKVKEFYSNAFNETIDEYFSFLVENQFVFFTSIPENFPSLNLYFEEPLPVSNCIIDRDSQSKYSIYNLIEQLEKINCRAVQMRFFYSPTIDELKKIIVFIDELNSIVSSVDIIVPSNIKINENTYTSLMIEHPRIVSIFIYNATTNKSMNPVRKNSGFLIFSSTKMDNEKSCGIISSNYFSLNIKTFTESQLHNTCLNRKISIDKDGNIKNCPSMPQSFGNIKDTTLEEAVNHPDFKKYWNVNKDMIAVCKDCEFRHICTDCRAYTERTHFDGEIDLSKPLKCGYNPYTNEWAEWSTNPLKEKAIEYYGMQDLVKKDA